MPRLKLHTVILVICLCLSSTVTAENLTSQISNLANDFASFKKEMTGNVKDINSGIKSMEDRLKTNTDLSMFSTLNRIFAARDAQTSNSKKASTTTPSPAGSNVASELMKGLWTMNWLKAFGDSQASQLGLPSGWLGAFGSNLSPPVTFSIYPANGFPNMKWLGAFAGDIPRLQQKPQEIVDYPVIIIPESSFYQIGQPLPRPYPIYPPSGYDQ
ncbi:hypothetical protein TELCIR_19782, partial [Teladorsagia circumcincta]